MNNESQATSDGLRRKYQPAHDGEILDALTGILGLLDAAEQQPFYTYGSKT